MISSDERVNYLMASSVQNGLKTMFFKDYSLLVVFNAYLRSKCTIPDIHVQLCRFGSDSFTQDSARLIERRKKEERR